MTGATGFIGRHIVPLLLDRGHSVTAVARNETRARSAAWFDRVHFVALDIHNATLSSEFLQWPDAVIHLAWPGLPNYRAPFHLEAVLPADYRFLKTLVDNGIGHLLVTGTCFEYGMQQGCLSEDMPAQPANSYAQAKDSLRKMLQSLQRKHSFILQWARLFYMYGPGQSANSLLVQLDRAIENHEPVFNMSGGEQLRDYLPVEEVASRLVTLLEHPGCDGIVNICSGEPVSIRSLVERHLAKRGVTIELSLGHYPYPDHEPMAFWGEGTKYARCCSNH